MKTTKLLSILAVLSCMTLSATNFNVTNGNDAGAGSLRQAITDAVADTTATSSAPHNIITNGAYTITLATALPPITRATIVNATGTNMLTINAVSDSSIIKVNGAIPVTLKYLILQGLNITLKTSTMSSAAVRNSNGGTMTVDHCIFQNNTVSGTSTIAAYGGALSSNTGALTVTNSIFKNNTILVNGQGAAIYTNAGTLTVTACTFEGNTGVTGGTIKIGANATCTNSTFTGNSSTLAAGAGSAIYTNAVAATVINVSNCFFQTNSGGPVIHRALNSGATGLPVLTISNCVIKNNTNTSTGAYGGAVGSCANTTITNTEISGNSGTRGGGVTLYVGTATYKSKLTMSNCTVSGNTSNLQGGGICIYGSAIDGTDNNTITNCTISGNTAGAASTGGGIEIGTFYAAATWLSKTTLNNCTITGNTSPADGAVNTQFGAVELNYCIVAGNIGSTATNMSRDIRKSVGIVSSSTGKNIYGGTIAFTGEVSGDVMMGTATDCSAIFSSSLADNGGVTLLPGAAATGEAGVTAGAGGYVKTLFLMPGSVAINPVAFTSGLQTKDQRGATRDLTPDMGAYEFGAVYSAVNTPVASSIAYQVINGQIIADLSGLVGVQTIAIYDISGKRILARQVVGGEKVTVAADLQKGVYVLLLKGAEGQSTTKLFVK